MTCSLKECTGTANLISLFWFYVGRVLFCHSWYHLPFCQWEDLLPEKGGGGVPHYVDKAMRETWKWRFYLLGLFCFEPL